MEYYNWELAMFNSNSIFISNKGAFLCDIVFHQYFTLAKLTKTIPFQHFWFSNEQSRFIDEYVVKSVCSAQCNMKEIIITFLQARRQSDKIEHCTAC